MLTGSDGPYTVEPTRGTKVHGAFAQAFPAYPFRFEFALDTLIDGVVYGFARTSGADPLVAACP